MERGGLPGFHQTAVAESRQQPLPGADSSSFLEADSGSAAEGIEAVPEPPRLHDVQDSISWAIGFAVPAAAMAVAIVTFLAGSSLYTHVEPTERCCRPCAPGGSPFEQPGILCHTFGQMVQGTGVVHAHACHLLALQGQQGCCLPSLPLGSTLALLPMVCGIVRMPCDDALTLLITRLGPLLFRQQESVDPFPGIFGINLPTPPLYSRREC